MLNPIENCLVVISRERFIDFLSPSSACTSASLEPSYVLRAIGMEEDLAHSSIRFGLGRFTTEEEVDFTVEQVVKHVNRLRKMR